MCAKVEAVREKKRRSLELYVQQVDGQFQLIRERVAEQKESFLAIEDHLRKEEEFRRKVFNRETSEVMKLI